jgi:hypothetical protein
MADYDFAPGSIAQFRGRMARGSVDGVPRDFAIDERNNEFIELGVKTRSGFASFLQTTGNWNGKVLRGYEYKKRNEASRRLVLDDTGKIWDTSTAMTTPILSIATMTDFSALTLYDRVYITPHDGERGLSNEKVYVYDGTGVARIAAGAGPSGYTLGAATGSTGIVDAGVHLFSVAFETASGHITKFGLAGAEVATYTAPGNKKVNLSGIPTGGSFVVARHIIVTKVIKDYNGNPVDKTWYFLPDGKISDNVTTVLNDINFYDTDLIDSASRLMDQLAEIPAGSCIGTLGTRMVVGGERVNDATLRVSFPGEPESMSDITGIINIDPGDAGGGVRNFVEYRSNLYVQKDFRFYVTSDNESDPSTWKAPQIDASQGTSTHGTAGVLDSKGQSLESFLICTRTGLYRFTGSFGDQRELSYVIEDLWKRINPVYFYKLQISIDPIVKRLYVSVPLDTATSPSHIFMGDFSEGLTADKIKWSIWTLPNAPSTHWVEVDWTTRRTIFRYGSEAGGVYSHTPGRLNDFNNLITSYYRPGQLVDSTGGVLQIIAVRVRAIGSGNLYLKLYALDDSQVSTLPSLTLSASPGKELTRLVGTFNSERISVEFGVSSIDHWYQLTKIRLAASTLWEL